MIDYFALALTHGLILVALLRILGRDERDREEVQTLAQADAGEAEAGSSQPPKRAGRTRGRG